MSQSIGLARAVGGNISEIETRLRTAWRFMPLSMIPYAKSTVYESEALDVEPPPHLVISCGRQSISSALYLRKKFGKRVFNVHIQDPTIDPANFDLVVAPKHDGATGPNVYQSMGALHHVTRERLDDTAIKVVAHSPWNTDKQIATVLVGGPNKYYPFSDNDVNCFIRKLDQVVEDKDVMLAITTSRRTPPRVAARLKKQFDENHFVWTGEGDNPYFASLAMASHIIVTGDSVSMITEASATGKPVLVEHLNEKRPAKRFRQFHAMFREAGITREFDGELTNWTYEPPRDTEKVATIIRQRMDQR